MKMLKILAQMVAQVIVFLLFFMMLGSLVGFTRHSISAAGEIHWLAGVFLGSIWLIGVFILYFAIWYAMQPSAPSWFREYVLIRQKTGSDAGLAEQYPVATLAALICVAMLVAVFALTGMSAVLASQGIISYTVEASNEQPMTELLFRLYAWHMIDMIPLLDLWQTYGIDPPIRPNDFWAQTIVLVFRTVIIGFAISVIVQWVKYDRDISAT
ncbi:MAG: hypothetical protein OEN50_13135 [Deltaproteobacteria bacterium]|nr:hypothetical protein [Deltaproteobacteria bacterium]